MEQYFVLVLTRAGDTWVGHSRDFPGLRIEAPTAEQAHARAAHAIRMEVHKLRSAGQPLPPYRSYADVRIDDAFARERGIRWTQAIVRMIPLPPMLQTIETPEPATASTEIPAALHLPRAS